MAKQQYHNHKRRKNKQSRQHHAPQKITVIKESIPTTQVLPADWITKYARELSSFGKAALCIGGLGLIAAALIGCGTSTETSQTDNHIGTGHGGWPAINSESLDEILQRHSIEPPDTNTGVWFRQNFRGRGRLLDLVIRLGYTPDKNEYYYQELTDLSQELDGRSLTNFYENAETTLSRIKRRFTGYEITDLTEFNKFLQNNGTRLLEFLEAHDITLTANPKYASTILSRALSSFKEATAPKLEHTLQRYRRLLKTDNDLSYLLSDLSRTEFDVFRFIEDNSIHINNICDIGNIYDWAVCNGTDHIKKLYENGFVNMVYMLPALNSEQEEYVVRCIDAPDANKSNVLILAANDPFLASFDVLPQNYQDFNITIRTIRHISDIQRILSQEMRKGKHYAATIITGHGTEEDILINNPSSYHNRARQDRLTKEDFRQLTRYKGLTDTIILYSCSTGRGEDPIARTAATSMNATAYAPAAPFTGCRITIEDGEPCVEYCRSITHGFNTTGYATIPTRTFRPE